MTFMSRLSCQLEVNRRCIFPDKNIPLSEQLGKQQLGRIGAEELGCNLRQHEAAYDLALQDMPRPCCQAKDTQALVEEVQELLELSKGKADLATARSLLAMNIFLEQQLASGSSLISCMHADVLQRKLAAQLPCAAAAKLTTQPDGAGVDQQQLQQLLCRCAIAKGRCRLEYVGHAAAMQLLNLLAQQNNPRIKAVLRLHADGSSRATTSPTDCSGDFELNFDVRGTLIPIPAPTEPLHVPEVNAEDIFALSAEAEAGLRRRWDSFDLTVQAEGTRPALALEICYVVMRRLQRDQRAACVVVRRSGRRLRLTLAELDGAVRCMALLNSPEVVTRAKDAAAAAELRMAQRPNQEILDRFKAVVTAADSLREVAGGRQRDAMLETLIGQMSNSGPRVMTMEHMRDALRRHTRE